MTGKAPAYQHFARDWLADTAHLSLEEQGALQRLLDHSWLAGALPSTARDRARLLGVTLTAFRRLWKRLSVFFPGGHNPRLEEIRREQQAYRAALSANGSRGAQKRWHGHGNGGVNGHPIGEANGQGNGETMRLQSASSPAPATEDQTETAALRARLPTTYHEVLAEYIRAAKKPKAVTAAILAECSSTATGETVGKALAEMAAAGKPFTPKLLRAFIGGLANGRADLSTADRARATAVRMKADATRGAAAGDADYTGTPFRVAT